MKRFKGVFSTRYDLFGLSLGLFVSLSQVILMREVLAGGAGNELLVGLGLAAWLLGVGLGASAAGRVPPKGAFVASLVTAGPLVLGSFFIARLHRVLVAAPVGAQPELHALLGFACLSMGLGGVTAGFLFTTAARAESRVEQPVSRLYAVEAVGALIAGVVFPFVLAGRVEHLSSLLGAWALTASAGACALLEGWRRRFVAAAVLTAASALLATGLPGDLDRRTQKAAFSALRISQELLRSEDSPYGRISLGRSHGQYEVAVDGRIAWVFPDPYERPLLIDLALLQHPAPKRVLIVGGGATDRLEPALDHGLEELVLTYVDPTTHDIIEPYLPLPTVRAMADERAQVMRTDGRELISKKRDYYDVIVVAAPPPLSGAANRYHTVEFFEDARGALRKGGVLTVQAPGGATVLAPEAAQATASERLSLKKVFDNVVLSRGNEVLLHGSNDPGVVSADTDLLLRRLQARPRAKKRVSAFRIDEAYDENALAGLRAGLDEASAVPNTDARPLSFLLNLSLWERNLPGADPSSPWTLTSAAVNLGWWTLLGPAAAWLVWRLWRQRSGSACFGDCGVSLFTTGAAGMAAQVLVLYAFQTASGQLYQWLALLVGLFMIGLAAGTWIARRRWARGTKKSAIVADSAAALFFGASAFIVEFFMGSVPFLLSFSAACGFVTGLAFPVFLARAVSNAGGDERSHASKAEAADHYGAAFGALFGGLVWLPVLGMTGTCLALAGLKVLSCLGHAFQVSCDAAHGD